MAPVKEGSRPLFLPPTGVELLDRPRSYSPSEGESIWGSGQSFSSLLPLLKDMSFTMYQRPGEDIFSPHVLIPHEPQECAKLTLSPSGPTGPGMPGTPGGPGLPFKNEQQKSGRLRLFPSFQEIRFVLGAQRKLWGR